MALKRLLLRGLHQEVSLQQVRMAISRIPVSAACLDVQSTS